MLSKEDQIPESGNSMGKLASEQGGELANGGAEKVYLSLQTDSLSDLNGVVFTLYDVAGNAFTFEFDVTGGGEFSEETYVVPVYASSGINETVADLSGMIDGLAMFDASLVAENVVKVVSIPKGNLEDATIEAPNGGVSIAIDQGIEMRVVPQIREILRVPMEAKEGGAGLVALPSFGTFVTESGDFVFVGSGHDYFHTTGCYQDEDVDNYYFVIMIDDNGDCSWIMEVRAEIDFVAMFNDSIVISASARWGDLTILGIDIQEDAKFFGKIGFDGIWDKVFSAPYANWPDSSSIYEIQDGWSWYQLLAVEDGIIVYGNNEFRSQSFGCDDSWFSIAKISPEGECMAQRDDITNIASDGMRKTRDGHLQIFQWRNAASLITLNSSLGMISTINLNGEVPEEELVGTTGEFPMAAFGTKTSDNSNHCISEIDGGTMSGIVYFAPISASTSVFRGNIVPDPANIPDLCPFSTMIVNTSTETLEIIDEGDLSVLTGPLLNNIDMVQTGLIRFGDGFCFVPGRGSGSLGSYYTETWWLGQGPGSGEYSGDQALSCFNMEGEITWWHEGPVQPNLSLCDDSASDTWYSRAMFEYQEYEGSLLRTMVINYFQCISSDFEAANNGPDKTEFVVELIDPPWKVDADGDGVLDLQDGCLETPLGAEADEFGCSWEQADDDGDGFSNVREVECDSDTNLSTSTPLDFDGDGLCDFQDDDDDDDGIADSMDVFPFDPTDWADSDGDGIGDNSDPDADGDGVDDDVVDSDEDGFYDHEDAFPFDPNEWLDSDGDGVGDNADAFPLDATEAVDTDGDGVGDNADADANGDGTDDSTVDTDGDGISDDLDSDDDGDGIPDAQDPDWVNPSDTTGAVVGGGSGSEDGGGLSTLNASLGCCLGIVTLALGTVWSRLTAAQEQINRLEALVDSPNYGRRR